MKKIICFVVLLCLSAGCITKTSDTATASFSDSLRPGLIPDTALQSSVNTVPKLEDYSFADDFNDVLNPSLVTSMDDAFLQKLRTNYFAVTDNDNYQYEFFELYEDNTYKSIPSYVTVDSLLHTFHLYYAYLQKNTERDALLYKLYSFSQQMYTAANEDKALLAGTEWESAANRLVDYYAIALTLCGGTPDSLSDTASQELAMINDAAGINDSPLFSTETRTYQQDYSQFKPRSYYTECVELEEYFRAMMWFGQMNFCADQDDLCRSALLNVLTMSGDALEQWSEVYMVTAFFAGESDDNGYYECRQLIDDTYGTDLEISQLAGDASGFTRFQTAAKALKGPKINSMVVSELEDRDKTTIGYRVMGQRFSMDDYIMQRLIYRDVASVTDSAGNEVKRMMPAALDVPAAFGSDEALSILQNTTNVNTWPDYSKNMTSIRSEISSQIDSIYTRSISQAWLSALTPLLETHDSGYPQFMRSTAWNDKDLNSYLGNYTELKHDTVLYSKQVLAEMGADTPFDSIKPDDRGYVEPQPVIYERLENISRAMVSGLQQYGLISTADTEAMNNLSDLAASFKSIAVKELSDELPTDEEFELIRSYGGQLEHLWLTTIYTGNDKSYMTIDYPAALVTDIATDGESGTCLELGTGEPDAIYVLVNFDGDVRIAKGAVYSYYEFTQPISDRLTDEAWRDMVRDYTGQSMPDRPSWVSSFYTLHELHTISYTNTGTLTVHQDQFAVHYSPSMDSKITGYAKNDGYYYSLETVEAEGYSWHKIADHQWFADDGSGSAITYEAY